MSSKLAGNEFKTSQGSCVGRKFKMLFQRFSSAICFFTGRRFKDAPS